MGNNEEKAKVNQSMDTQHNLIFKGPEVTHEPLDVVTKDTQQLKTNSTL